MQGLDIAVLDFGGQYVFNIRRVLLEKGFNAEIVPYDVSPDRLRGVKGVILSGGPYSVYDEDAPLFDLGILRLGVPVLGLCYGHQAIAYLLGGEVKKGRVGEYGFSEMSVDTSSELFRGLKEREICWMSHGDVVSKLPPGFKVIASSDESPIAAFQGEDRIFGLQFHPEVSHTPNGHRILENFAELCGCPRGSWDIKAFIDAAIKDISTRVGSEKAIIAVSGGVDSTTAAVLAGRALGDRLACVHINHGLMRKHESENVIKFLKKLGLNVAYVDAEERFLKALQGVTAPDYKRVIVGKLFIDEFEEASSRLDANWLIQGTIAPDIIESTRGDGKRRSDRGHGGLIKIHHNVAGLPKGMKLKLIEPLSPLFKYQVRTLASELGLPRGLVERQPFPGPGLSCRISGEITREKLELLREVNEMVERALRAYRPSQYFAVLLTGKIAARSKEAEFIASKYLNRDVAAYKLRDESVGVKGDERILGVPICIDPLKSLSSLGGAAWINLLKMQNEITGTLQEICRVLIKVNGIMDSKEGYCICIRAVDTLDFMTAVPSKVDFGHLHSLGRQIIGRFDSVTSVCYEITTKPAATIEFI
ncbi:MAG: glutamine-hydrolyzing GMP synthase [Candidatus Bathyarchaeia archaeon]